MILALKMEKSTGTVSVLSTADSIDIFVDSWWPSTICISADKVTIALTPQTKNHNEYSCSVVGSSI